MGTMLAGFTPVQLNASFFLLVTLVAIIGLAVTFYQIGLLGCIVQIISLFLEQSTEKGFQLWRRLLSWASWPLYGVLILGLLGSGLWYGTEQPVVALGCGLGLLFVGVIVCLAYVYLDLERYEVGRGRKALTNPHKGQEMAVDLLRYGHQVGLPLLAAAALGTIGGFALLNQGVYETVGRDWYHLRAGPTVPGRSQVHGSSAAGNSRAPVKNITPPDYADFLAYTLIHLFQIVDLLNIAGTYNLELSYVHQDKWPASTLLMVFKSFFTLVLLQQLFSSIRQVRLLSQTIEDFWSPYQPIHEQAAAILPQYGARAIEPLLISLRVTELLTPELRREIPELIALSGPATIPTLVRYLRDPHENVRAVAVAALGRLQAPQVLPQLIQLRHDPSDLVRQNLVEALGMIGAKVGQPVRTITVVTRGKLFRGRWFAWLIQATRWVRRRPKRVPQDWAVEILRMALTDPSTGVRKQAAASLGLLGPAATTAVPDLIGLFHDADETIRCQAAEALGKMGASDDTTMAALVELVQDASPAVQKAAASALGALKQEAAPAVSSLIPLLHDADAEVRTTTAEVIGRIGILTEESTSDLVAGLSHPDNLVRAQTAEALGTIGEPAAEAVPALIETLADANDRVRVIAAEALGKIGPAAADAVPGLMQALHDADTLVRVKAALALGEMGAAARPALPDLVESLRHSNPRVRSNAAWALGKIGTRSRQAIPALEITARDENGEVRSQAIFALGEMGGHLDSSGRVLLSALEDPDAHVRSAAVKALGKRRDLHEAGIQALFQALRDPSPEVKIRVSKALPKRAGATPEVIEGLCRLLRDDTSEVQISAASALGKLGPAARAAGSALVRALQTAETAVRQRAIRAIAMIQPPEAPQAFAVGLKDANGVIRKLASAGLMKRADIPEPVIPDLVEALRDPEIQVRSNAAHVLARLKDIPAPSIPLLVDCTSHPDDGLRLNALLALKAASADAVDTVLEHVIADANWRIRLEGAGLLLGKNPAHPQAGTVVVQALSEGAVRYRKTAIEIVRALGPGGAIFLEVCKQRMAVEAEEEIRVQLTTLVETFAPQANEDSATQVPAGWTPMSLALDDNAC